MADAPGAELQQRLNDLLDSTLGPGKARVSVNLVLDRDRSSATSPRYGRTATALSGRHASTRLTSGATRYRERSDKTTWARGARLTATAFAPGAVRQVHVGLIVDSGVARTTAARLKRVVAAAAGVNRARGDTLAVTRSRFAPAAAPAPTRALIGPGLRSGLALGRRVLLAAGIGTV